MTLRSYSAVRVRAGGLVALAGLLAACHDVPTLAPSAADAAPAPLAQIVCTVQVRPASMACGDGIASAGGASRTVLTMGGQHHYLRLSSGAPAFTAVDSVFAFTVTVQNLMYAPLGTSDGTTPDASGVRVFFSTQPSNGATVVNPSGTGTFTGTGQDYFQYSGAELGPNGILSPDETSTAKQWQIGTHGAASFTFTVYVQAERPASVDFAEHFTEVATNSTHSCGLTAAGKAYCWGADDVAQLGNGSSLTADQGVPSPVDMSTLPAGVTFTQISTGNSYTCALGSDAKGYCWGTDSAGQLGNGAVTGDQASPSAVDMTVIPAGVTFTQISTGLQHTCALGSNGKGYCWGNDSSGQLGNGSGSAAKQSPSQVSMNNVPAGVTFARISAGLIHTCALGSDAKGYCWGQPVALGTGPVVVNNSLPEPVDTTPLPAGVTFTQISAGNNYSCAVGSDTKSYCWGTDLNGRLGNGAVLTANQVSPSPVDMTALPTGVTLTQISAGVSHTCALGSDAKGYCWGSDSAGRLGNGALLLVDQVSPSAVSMPAGVAFSSISQGTGNQSCAPTSDGLYCWGHNSSRQLGEGTATDRSSPVIVAGSW